MHIKLFIPPCLSKLSAGSRYPYIYLINSTIKPNNNEMKMITQTALLWPLCAWLLLLHTRMSSAWERVRLRIETKTGLEPVEQGNQTMATISSHILDTSLGKAVPNIPITLYRLDNAKQWQQLGQATTNADGRVAQLVPSDDFKSGIYKLHFNVHPYYEKRDLSSFYPFIEIVVQCKAGEHYHIPLLLNAYGYTTYRGT